MSTQTQQEDKRKRYTLKHGTCPVTAFYKHQIGCTILVQRHAYLGIFDEPGLGKTFEVLSGVFDMLAGDELDAVVVVCKKAHVRVWREQIDEHFADLLKSGAIAVQQLSGQPPKFRMYDDASNVHIMNYELLAKTKRTRGGMIQGPWGHGQMRAGADAIRLQTFLKSKRCALIIDESQAIASPTSNTTKVLCSLGRLAVRRYALTGTPIAERPDDLWSQVYFLDHGKLLGRSFRAFLSTYCYMHPVWQRPIAYRNLDLLRRKLSTISIRRKQFDCLDLPPHTFQNRYLDPADEKQKRLIATLRDELICELKAMSEGGIKANASKPIQDLMRASAVPSVVDGTAQRSAKLEALDEVLNDISGQLMVWCHHRNVADATRVFLEDHNHSVALVHGGIRSDKRDASLADFKRNGKRVLVATLDTLRESETLTNVQHAVYLQLDWKLINWTQSRGRLLRIGQRGTVLLETFQVCGTLDEFIHDTLLRKEHYASSTTDGIAKDHVARQQLLQYLLDQ